MGGKQQAVLSAFFKKAKTTKEDTPSDHASASSPSIDARTATTIPAKRAKSPILSRSPVTKLTSAPLALQKQFAFGRTCGSTSNDTDDSNLQQDLEKRQRHEKFIKTFGDLEATRALKRLRLEQHESSLENTATASDDASMDAMEQDSTPPSATTSSPSNLFATFANKNVALPSPPNRRKAQTTSPNSKYTPLEQQVVDLKQKYPGVLLVIEVGYKFRFFGEDAKVKKETRWRVELDVGVHVNLSLILPGRIEGASYCSFC